MSRSAEVLSLCTAPPYSQANAASLELNILLYCLHTHVYEYMYGAVKSLQPIQKSIHGQLVKSWARNHTLGEMCTEHTTQNKL